MVHKRRPWPRRSHIPDRIPLPNAINGRRWQDGGGQPCGLENCGIPIRCMHHERGIARTQVQICSWRKVEQWAADECKATCTTIPV